MSRSHYDVLGVAPDATATVIRESYRRLAREYHPDRTGGSAAGGDKMHDINAAYHVLSDPGRRAVYDAERRERPVWAAAEGGTSVGSDGQPGYRFAYPDGPARIPWRGLLVASAVAIIGIVVLAQFIEPGEPAPPDGVLRNGDCVEILANGDADEIACTGSGDVVVRQFIAFDRLCSNGWEKHRDRQGMGAACVEFTVEVAVSS
ncbi:J domain-containing protein [Ilumatobacter sp.]|uniref:J domain-containing protein n=1 Tax=Ilumatobacter sp. TaxID=1967498 RepID=UPI003C50F3A1